jgi:hypothetical protein
MLLALPAAAPGWAEVTTRDQPGGDPATCLRPAGGGLLSVVGPAGRRATAFDLLAGSRLAPAGRARFKRVFDCAEVAANDAGAAVVAVGEFRRPVVALRVATRAATGRVRARTVATSRLGLDRAPGVAVGPRGDVAIAWVERRQGRRAALLAATRPSGGRFSEPRPIRSWRAGGFAGNAVPAVGVDAAGAVTLVWAEPSGRALETVRWATASRGAAFSRPRTVVRRAQDVESLELDVRPSGEALLAFVDSFRLRLFERTNGGFEQLRGFGRSGTFPGPAEPALAQAGDGSAVLAWRIGEPDGPVRAVTRAGTAAFGRPVELGRTRPDASSGGFGISLSGGVPYDESGGAVRAAIGAGGRAVVTWTRRRAMRGERLPTAFAAVGRASGAFRRPARLSSPCRPADGAAPATLPDGRLGAAWTDNLTEVSFPGFELPRAQGRLHLALADEPRPQPAKPPRVRVSAPRVKRLGFGDPLRVRVHCDRACDIRGLVPRRPGDGRDIPHVPVRGPRAAGTDSLAGAGSAVVRLVPGFDSHVAPKNPRRVRVLVRACSRGGDRFTTASTTVNVLRSPVPPLVRLLDVTARRRGRRVVVRWRTDRPARRVRFAVVGQARRGTRARPLQVRQRRGRGRTRFRVTLRGARGERVRWIRLFAVATDQPTRERDVRVRVR